MRSKVLAALPAGGLLLAGGCHSGDDGPRVPAFTPEQAVIKVPGQQELPLSAVIHADREGKPAGQRPGTDAHARAGEPTSAKVTRDPERTP